MISQWDKYSGDHVVLCTKNIKPIKKLENNLRTNDILQVLSSVSTLGSQTEDYYLSLFDSDVV